MADSPVKSSLAAASEGTAIVETHPDRLAVVAALMGLKPPPVGSCRVLELGCASGENLIPMALAIPGARFLGLDASARQVETGQQTIRELGLSNIELRTADLADPGDGLGMFDYFLCHGVYSWVPEPTRAAILDLCGRSLSPDGIAYISYNTYPGWHFPAIVRDLMTYHVREIDDPNEQVRRARDLLDQAEQALPEPDGLFGRIFRIEAAKVRDRSDGAILQEQLARINTPFYFHEFLAQARDPGLSFVGDARLGTLAAVQPPRLRQALEAWSTDPLEQEQYFDFLRNRRFRRTLLCRADRKPWPSPRAEVVAGMRVEALALPESAEPDTASTAPEHFQLLQSSARLTITEPPIKALLAILAGSSPRSIPFETLHPLLAGRLMRAGHEAMTTETTAALVLNAYVAGLIDLHLFEPQLVERPGDRPEATALARSQAESGRPIVSQRHRIALLGDFDRLVLRHLDGRRDRPALLRSLVEAAASGAFPVRDTTGQAITEPDLLGPLLDRSIEPSLWRINSTALLIG